MGDYKSTGITNLIRHSSGIYYLQAKILGIKVRRSLRTKDKTVARYRLGDALEETRAKAEGAASMKSGATTGEVALWSGLVSEWLASEMRRPDLKPNSKLYYGRISTYLEACVPGELLVGRLSARDAEQWWEAVARSGRPPRVANNMLGAARKMMAIAMTMGLRRDDPFSNLGRMKIRDKKLVVPTEEEIGELLLSIRSVGKAHSAESTDFIEFLAFTGMRIGELREVRWEDVGKELILVTGGKKGTKSGKEREVPIGRRVGALLERRRGAHASGKIFDMKSPREALNNACERLGLPHLRVHDLRHVFATQCIEAGVDPQTLAKWMGHQDGGILVMKTYGHVRDEHVRRMAKLIG